MEECGLCQIVRGLSTSPLLPGFIKRLPKKEYLVVCFSYIVSLKANEHFSQRQP